MFRRKYTEIICPVCELPYSQDDYDFCPYCAARDLNIEDIYDDDQDVIIGENLNEL